MDISHDTGHRLLAAYREEMECVSRTVRERRASLEQLREDSRQRLKACEINRAAHEGNMAKAAQLEHQVELDHRRMIERIVDAHFQSPLPADQREEIIQWFESHDLRN